MVIQILNSITFNLNSLIINVFKLFIQEFLEIQCQLLNLSYDYTYKNIIEKNELYRILDIAKLIGINVSNLSPNDLIINKTTFNKTTLINDMYNYYINNDNISNIKEYCDNFANEKLYEFISNLLNITNNDKILSGCYKYSRIINQYNTCQITINELKPLIIMDALLNNKIPNINTNNILQIDIQPNKYPIIFFDLHISYKNLIHAQCCNKIKQLKLRGTKSEPLFLQFIMQTLETNGRACIIIPDHFLFNDSNQHAITRQYLLTKFNLISIIQIDENYYYKKNQKYSILHFENNKKNNSTIEFMKLNLNGEVENIIYVNLHDIIKNNYILYYKTYVSNINKLDTTYTGKMIILDDIFDFVNKPDNISKEYITINKVLKQNSITIDKFTNNTNTYLIEKHDNLFTSEFLNYYILSHLINSMNKLIRGITNIYDIEAIKQLNIPLISIDMQQIFMNYVNNNTTAINNYKGLINNYTNAKINIINLSIITFETEPILNACNFMQLNEFKQTTDALVIYKNGLKTGSVDIYNNNNNNNMYYITVINNYRLMYIYYWLWYHKNHIFSLSNLKEQPLLTKYIFQTLNIHKLSLDKQNKLIDKCKAYDDLINKCNKDIEYLNNERTNFLINL
jgi:hypothetical protein